MSKSEFMKTLEELLNDIPMEEKKEALQFYDCYFEDAGPEYEQDIITELGSPDKVAASIKAGIDTSGQEAQSRGYFTEKGYEDDTLKDPKYEIQYRTDNNRSDNGRADNSRADNSRVDNSRTDNSKSDTRRSGPNAVLIMLLCIFAIPVGIPLLATVFSLFAASFFTVIGISIAFIVMSFVFTILGLCLAFLGLLKLVTMPIMGICIAGAGLILFGLGLLCTVATVGLCTKVIPAVFRFFVDICRLPFRRRGVMA